MPVKCHPAPLGCSRGGAGTGNPMPGGEVVTPPCPSSPCAHPPAVVADRLRRGGGFRERRGLPEAPAQAALPTARPQHLCLHRGPVAQAGHATQGQGEEPLAQVPAAASRQRPHFGVSASHPLLNELSQLPATCLCLPTPRGLVSWSPNLSLSVEQDPRGSPQPGESGLAPALKERGSLGCRDPTPSP